MEGLELIAFNIIASVGTARSLYIEAIDMAKEGRYDEARANIAQGDEIFTEGHKAHGEILQRMASGEKIVMDVLMVHAEDQLMSAEAFGVLANKFVELYETLAK